MGHVPGVAKAAVLASTDAREPAVRVVVVARHDRARRIGRLPDAAQVIAREIPRDSIVRFAVVEKPITSPVVSLSSTIDVPAQRRFASRSVAPFSFSTIVDGHAGILGIVRHPLRL